MSRGKTNGSQSYKMLRGSMPFNLAQAIEVLNSKYKVTNIDPYTNHDGLDAEIPFTLDEERLHIEIAVDATSLIATEVHSIVVGPKIRGVESMHLEKRPSTYLQNPKIVRFLNQIKADLGIP